MDNSEQSIPMMWIRDYVTKLSNIAKSLEQNSTMQASLISRVHSINDLVHAFEEYVERDNAAKIDNTEKTQNDTTKRFRPRTYSNWTRLTLERGDGECIDLGLIPDLSKAIEVARLVVGIDNALKKCGTYRGIPEMTWSPKRLEFGIHDVVASSENHGE